MKIEHKKKLVYSKNTFVPITRTAFVLFSERLKGTKSKRPAVLIRAGHSEYVRALDGQETYDNDSSNYNIIWGLERMRTDRGAWVRMRGKNWDRDVYTHKTDYAVISISLGSPQIQQ